MSEIKTVEELVAPQEQVSMRNCDECEQSFEVPPFKIAAQYVKICPTCSEKRVETQMQALREKAKTENRRLELWRIQCPEDFQGTVRDRIPNPVRYDKVMAWTYGRKGIVLHGPTGRGKSRCAWELLRREHMAGRVWKV